MGSMPLESMRRSITPLTSRCFAAARYCAMREMKVAQAEPPASVPSEIEGPGDGAKDGEDLDGGAAVEERARRRKNVVDAVAVERVEVVIEFRQAPQQDRVAAQLAAARADPLRD